MMRAMMLYDAITQVAGAIDPHGLRSPERSEILNFMKEKLPSVPRFVLERDAVWMVGNFTLQRPSSFLRALPWCRLPDREVWIEFAHAHYRGWLDEAAALGLREVPAIASDTTFPIRQGFFLREFTSGTSRFLRFVNASVFPGGHVDVRGGSFDVCLDGLDDSKMTGMLPSYSLSDYEEVIKSDLAKLPDSETKMMLSEPKEITASAKIITMIRCSWKPDRRDVSVFQLLIAAFVLLNTKNILRQSPEGDLHKINRSRVRSGKPPLLSHRSINVNLSRGLRLRVQGHSQQNGGKKVSIPCFVRGHFKIRKSGIYWWNAYSRSGPGAKPREYTVATDQAA